MRLTVPLRLLGTNTEPSGATAGLCGPSPTLNRATTFNVRGFSRTTSRPAPDATQTARSETATESGRIMPTGTAPARFVAGSTR